MEKARNLKGVDYTLCETSLDYYCNHCLASGVKLFREYAAIKSSAKLLCKHCAVIEKNGDSTQIIESLSKQSIDDTDLVPAIFSEDDDKFYPWNAIPKAGITWWINLPTNLADYPLFDLAELEAKVDLSDFEITLTPLLKAVSVAKELGMKFIPKAWIVYIQSGWRIVDHLNGFTWIKPLPSGSMSVVGLITEKRLDIKRLLDTKKDLGLDIKNELRNYFPKRHDIGKIFYLKSEVLVNEKKGKIVTREELLKINPSEIRSWMEIDDFDVIDFE